MPKKSISSKVGKVSETTLNPKKIIDEELTPDGLKKDSEEAKELDRQRQFLSRIAKPSFESAANARRKYDQEWIARNLFWRGYQFSRYLPQTQTVVLSSRQNTRVPINLTAAFMRAIRNSVTSFRPKFEVMPEHMTDERSKTNARYAQRLLDYYFDHLKLKKKIKETITQALLYSIGGPWEIVYDKQAKEIKIYLLDPFDFYIDPLAEEYDEAEFLVKAVRRPQQEILFNRNFSPFARKEITTGDNVIAASQYKQFMIQALRQVSPRIVEGSPTVILYEGFFRKRRETGEPYLIHAIWTVQNMTPLLYEELDTNEYDFVVYRGDLNPKEIYGESWIKHLMPVNRVLNSLESSAFEYNYKVAKGRIVVDRDSGVRAIHNVHGEIISKNRGAEVKSLDLAPLPVAVPQQIERMWRYMEDISGLHEASLGRIPTGVKCVDLKTKCLTKRGFVTMDKLRNGDEIYTVNQKTLNGEWQPLITVHKYEDFEGELYQLKNRNIDALVTAHHKWFVKQTSGIGKKTHFLIEMKDVKLQHSILLGAKLMQEHKEVYSNSFVKLVGWILTEGTYKKGKEKSWAISISQSYLKNPDKCREIIQTVSENTNDFYMMKSESNHALRVNFSKELGRKIRTMFPDKILSYEFVNSLTVKQMELLKRVMILADGNVRGKNERFFTTEKKMADVFIYMMTLLGHTCHQTWYKRSKVINHKDYCEISIKKSKYTDAFNTNRKESYLKKFDSKQMVWCPETVNGTFIAERNGSIYVTGNSGIGVAELKQADATSQDDFVDNLEDFLSEVAHKILKKIADNYSTFQVVRDLGVREGDEKYFAVIGKKFASSKKNKIPGKEGQIKIGTDWLDIAEISGDNTIRVGVGSWLGYTKESMQQKVLSYFQMQLIDQKTALKLLEFGQIDEIVQQTRLESLLKRPPNPQNPDEPDQMSLAMSENDMLIEGKEMPVSEMDDHFVHIAVHQEALGRGQDENVGIHIQKHIIMSGKNPVVSASNGMAMQDTMQPGVQSGMMGANTAPTNMMSPEAMAAQSQPPVTNPNPMTQGMGGALANNQSAAAMNIGPETNLS